MLNRPWAAICLRAEYQSCGCWVLTQILSRVQIVCIGSIKLIASQSTLDKVQNALQALPFVLKTESKRQSKVDLEAKLEEICRSQNLLKQETVLVTL